MKKIGILGGMGPESTVDYYKMIIRDFRAGRDDNAYPQILINSIDMTEMLSYVASGEYDKLVNLLVEGICRLKDGGADFALMATNTPHVVFDRVEKKSPLPLISIVEATALKAEALNLKKLLLIGTGFTMKNTFYQQSVSPYGISLSVPSPENQEIIHNIIFPELEEGIVVPEKKIQMINICKNIIKTENIDGIILGCTELPLMIKNEDLDIEVLNTAQIHIEAAVKMILSE